METSPDVLLSSRRIGPLTLSVRSKLPLADGPIAQPAFARAATTKPARAATLRCPIVPPIRVQSGKPPAYSLSLKPVQRKIRKFAELCAEGGVRSRAFLLQQRLVQRALAVAFEVQRDISEAGTLQCLGDCCARFLRGRTVHLFWRDFDAS